MTFEIALPAFNAGLILAAGVALVTGRVMIARGRETAHKRAMLSALALTALFLVVYVTRWAVFGSKSYEGDGPLRSFYFALLLSHMLLAVGIIPPVLITLKRGLRDEREKHRAIAPYTFWLWLVAAASGWGVWFPLWVV